MDARKKVLLVGDSALMAVTEAALEPYLELQLTRVCASSPIPVKFEAILIERGLPEDLLLALTNANPGALVIVLDWQQSSFSSLIARENYSLTIEHIAQVLGI